MCGIVGYVGKKPVVSILVDGLSKLEYRGYDSAGIAIFQDKNIKIFKAQGKLQNLKDLLAEKNAFEFSATMGIGHIRWATHGIPNTINAHPHRSNCERIAIVHNGIIENWKELKEFLIDKGCIFSSETDTEVIAHLISHEYDKSNDFLGAVRDSLKQLKGAFALGVMCEDYKDTLIAARRNAPLIIGLGEGENFIGSDIPAIIEHTKKAVYLDDNEIAKMTPDSVEFFDMNGESIDKKDS